MTQLLRYHDPARAGIAFVRARASASPFGVLYAEAERSPHLPSGGCPPVHAPPDRLFDLAEEVFERATVLPLEVQRGAAWAITGIAGPEHIEEGAREFVARARRERLSLSLGIAHNVGDGAVGDLALEVLLAVAREGARVASLAGGNGWCHSELYEFYERQLGVAPIVAAAASLRERRPRAQEPTRARETAACERRVDRLKRRLAKVCAELEAAHAEVARLHVECAADPGIASRTRRVQGLSPFAAHHDLKCMLLSSIFRANRALQARRRDRSSRESQVAPEAASSSRDRRVASAR